jgi:4-hydroxybenzoate polyprenyltransferase
VSLRDLLKHLRLNWHLMLLPIFLWGFLLSGGPVTYRFWLGLFVLHVLFYGGSVAFNSYYDQDEGPIGGLWNPPRPTRALLWFSLAIQAVGFAAIAFINPAIVLLALIMFGLSTAYSHPAVRLKAHPWASLLTVSVGQGVGGFMAGWLCGQNDPATLSSMPALLGGLVAVLVTTGFYPLTQIYQREEDQRRGDVTFAVRWGERAFPFSIACFLLAAVAGGILAASQFEAWAAPALVAGMIGLSVLVFLWWRQFDEAELRRNYQQLMRIGYVMASGFLLFIGYELVRRFSAM